VRSLNLVRAIHGLIGVDIQDPRTTWGDEVFREQRVDLAYDENFAGNPIHLILVLATFAAIWPVRRRLTPNVVPYAVALVAGFLLFAAVLRWQPWDSRLELPWFVLSGPLIGVVCEAISARLAVGTAAILLASMLPWVLNNQARPLLGTHPVLDRPRASQYFAFQPDLESAYTSAVAYLADSRCTQIGLLSNQDGWEFPVWALSAGPVKIEHVEVANVSSNTAPLTFQPCAVLALGPAFADNPIQIHDQTFRTAWRQDDVAVLTPEAT